MTDSSSWAFAGCMDIVNFLLLLLHEMVIQFGPVAAKGYRALWASSALRAAANASLSTGGMHLMLAGLPHSFTVLESLSWTF